MAFFVTVHDEGYEKVKPRLSGPLYVENWGSAKVGAGNGSMDKETQAMIRRKACRSSCGLVTGGSFGDDRVIG